MLPFMASVSSGWRAFAPAVRITVFAFLLSLFGAVCMDGAAVHAQDVGDTRSRTQVSTDTVEAGRFDDGRMWTFDAPPLDYFENRYDFRPSDDWMERARLGTVRIPGCTGSFVSPHGLLMTNHHCGRSHATAVAESGENILQDGFYASSQSAERAAPSMHADQLVSITDVTDEVEAAVDTAQTDAERADARQQATAAIQKRLVAEAGGEGYRVEVIPLYNGARYSAYTFRRYTDVRLVFIPELDLGYFGGDTDNFTYPRYALDVALFRVYGDDGEPLDVEHYFPWSEQGSRPGDPVFVVGNPGSTLRLETHDQLAFRRDVQDPNLLRYLETRVDALRDYTAAADTPASAENAIFSLKNAAKLYRGRVEALNDAYIMTRVRKGDAQFVRALRGDPALRQQYGGLVDSMAALQQAKREHADAYQAFRLLQNPAYASATLSRALTIRAAGFESGDAIPSERASSLQQQLRPFASQSTALDRRFLAERLRDFETYFGTDHAITTAARAGDSPSDRAETVVSTSVFADTSRLASMLEAGTVPTDDPALDIITAFFDRYQSYRSAWSGLTARQDEVARQIGQARYAVYGTDVPPDASFSLRLSDGVVRGYNYNGTVAPPYTTFYGMYEHNHAYGPDSEWSLPAQWQRPPASFERSTPVNLVSTNDITGGNSGSPLLNENLEVVGLIFDGNIESLAGDFIYLPGRMRAVSVDVRGIQEALDDIYDADRLVHEATEGELIPTESAAPESP
jgi:hypothetical protein